MQYTSGHVTAAQASWAGTIIEESKRKFVSKHDIEKAERIWAQWRHQGEKE